MSGPTTNLSPPPAAPAAEADSARPAGAADRLAALCDPEWLWFLGFALLPAGACCLLGATRPASFFFGAALYAAALKWLGWALLGRRTDAPRRDALFPVELFAGLAVACVWFYARNALAALWPASYGLGEGRALVPLLAGLHLFVAGRRALARARAGQPWRPARAEAVRHAALYLPFWGTLAVALCGVSGSLNPQTIDPTFHAFAARAYVETGLAGAHPFVGRPLVYPSAFGAVNATALALAPLDPAQALNLQHVLWHLAALFLLAVTPALLAGRWFRLLGLAPLVFVALLPLYALHPDDCYSATPRQMAVALWPALGVLPLLTPARGAGSLAAAGAVVAVLGVLSATMNPACAPFAALLLLVALGTFLLRARRALGWPLLKTLALDAGLLALAMLLVLGRDQYYAAQVRHEAPLVADSPVPAAPEPGAPGPAAADATPAEPPPDGVRFSLAAGLRALSPAEVLTLAKNATLTRGGRNEQGIGWPRGWPYRGLPAFGLAVALGLAALVLGRRRRGAALPAGTVALTLFALGCGLTWLAGKAAVLVLIGGTTGPGAAAEMLRIYLGFMLLRWDLLLLFAGLCAAAVALHLLGEKARPAARLLLPLGATTAGLLLLAGVATGHWPRAGDVVVRVEPVYFTTPDDLAVAAWCDRELPRASGLIGMAAGVGRTGPGRTEEHVTGVGGVSAFLLHGRRGGYCFTVRSLEGERWYDDYSRHVKERLDPDWCRDQGIHYFYASPVGLSLNPGLVRAIEAGELRELYRAGESAIYEVR